MPWLRDLAGLAARRGIGPRRALGFLRRQVAIRAASLMQELRGAVADLREIHRPSSDLLLIAHGPRLRPGGLIEVGQADLCRRLVAEAGATVVRSRLGYRLRRRGGVRVVSLEPFTNAPPVRFRRDDRSAVFVADTWDKAWMARHLARSRADHLLTPYLWPVASDPALRRTGEERWRLFPWWVPDDVLDRHPPRGVLEPRLVVAGASGAGYDLRRWVAGHALVAEHLHVSNYEADAVSLPADAYFTLLARHSAVVVAFSESEALRAPVAKCVEVPAVGSLLMAARAHHLVEMGFVDGENCLVFEGREDFEARVRPFLADAGRFVDVARRGQELVRARHTTSVRLAELLALLSMWGPSDRGSR